MKTNSLLRSRSLALATITAAVLLALAHGRAAADPAASAAFGLQPQAAGQIGVVDTTNIFGNAATYLGPTYTVPSGGDTFDGFYDAFNQTGIVTHSSGTLTLNNYLELADGTNSNGTYNLSGTGTINTPETDVGFNHIGVFNQSGGAHNVGSTGLLIGLNSTGANGTYTLSGGTLSVTGRTDLGYKGTAVFTQSGGTATLGAVTFVGGASTASGAVNLNSGGTLNVTSIALGGASGGTSTFNFNGGALQPTSSNGTTFFPNVLTTANVRNGGAIFNTNGFNVTVAQPLVHSTVGGDNGADGGLTKNGAGTLTLTGANTYTGATNVSAGTLALGAGGSVTGSAVNVSPGATLTVSGGSVNTGGGATTFNVGSATGAATATANLSSGSLATSYLNVGNANGGAGVFNQTGGAATYLNLEVAQVAGSTGTYNQSAGAVTTTSSGSIAVGAAAGAAGTYNLSGTGQLNAAATSLNVGLNGTGVFNQTGGTVATGTYHIQLGVSSGSNGTYTLGGGVLQGGGAQGGSGTSTFHFAGGTLQATASFGIFFQSLTVADVRGNGGAIIDTQNCAVTVAQPLVHDTSTSATDGGLTKQGTGTLTLTGANTYTGATTVSAGTLLANNTAGSGTGTGAVTLGSGGTLGGTGAVAGAVTVQNGGRLDAGNAGATGVLSLGSGLSLNTGATLAVQLGGTAPGTGYDQIRVVGTLTLGGTLSVTEISGFKLSLGQTFVISDDTGTSLVTTTFANAPGGLYTDAAGNTFLVNYAAIADADLAPNDVTLTAVPEPGAWVPLAVGAGALALALRRQRRSTAVRA